MYLSIFRFLGICKNDFLNILCFYFFQSGPLQPPYLFKSNLGSDHTYLRILPLTPQGAPARGTRVDLTDPSGRTQVRVIDAGR